MTDSRKSQVIGLLVTRLTETLPSEMLASERWKNLVSLVNDLGDEKESERLAVVMDWMWVQVERAQSVADKFIMMGEIWRRMTTQKTYESAGDAAESAHDGAHDGLRSIASSVGDAVYYETIGNVPNVIDYSIEAVSAVFLSDDDLSWEEIDPYRLLEKLLDA